MANLHTIAIALGIQRLKRITEALKAKEDELKKWWK